MGGRMSAHKRIHAFIAALTPVPILILVLTACPNQPGIFSEIAVFIGNSGIISGKSYDFGTAHIGSSTSVTFTIKNLGTDPLTLRKTDGKAVAIEGTGAGAFSVASQPGLTIAGGDSKNFSVVFPPPGIGDVSATIKVASSDLDEELYTVKITGTGSSVPISDISVRYDTSPVPNGLSVDIGNQLVDTVGDPHTFTIENAGSADLVLTNVLLVYLGGEDAAMFDITSYPGTDTIPTGSSETFDLTFSPTAAGPKSVIVYIPTNDPDETSFSFTVTAIADAAPDINIKQNISTIPTGTAYDFTTLVCGDSSGDVTFVIENTGTADLNLSGVPVVDFDGLNLIDAKHHFYS